MQSAQTSRDDTTDRSKEDAGDKNPTGSQQDQATRKVDESTVTSGSDQGTEATRKTDSTS